VFLGFETRVDELLGTDELRLHLIVDQDVSQLVVVGVVRVVRLRYVHICKYTHSLSCNDTVTMYSLLSRQLYTCTRDPFIILMKATQDILKKLTTNYIIVHIALRIRLAYS